MGRVAGIDFGTVRIGLALSDETHFLATPLTFIPAGKTAAQAISSALSKYGPLDAVIVGLPLHLNGKDSPLCALVREFAELLKQFLSAPILLWDERLTTAQVERTLKEENVSRKKRVPLIDARTAAAILQSYLDAQGRGVL